MQPLLSVADSHRIALMGFSLGLESFIEFAAGVGHAAHEPNARLTADGVVSLVAIDLKISAITFGQPQGHRLVTRRIVIKEDDRLPRRTAPLDPEVGFRLCGFARFLGPCTVVSSMCRTS